MKKLLFSVVALFVVATAAAQQDASKILDRYAEVTGISKFNSGSSYRMMMDVSMDMDMQGQKITMPVKMIMQNPGNKMRVETEMQGQKVLLVINGDKGWQSVMGQVQALPADMINKVAKENNMLEKFSFDKSAYNVSFVESKTVNGVKCSIIKAVPKAGVTPEIPESMITVDDATGLVTEVSATVQGQVIVSTMADYKKFGQLYFPSKMKINVGGGMMTSTLVINAVEFDYPTADWMFVEPK